MMEDIFSEELVDVPDDIERVIEDGADEIRDGSGRESGNEEIKNEDDNAKDKVKVKRKSGPRPTLNAQRLKGPRGIGIMESFFSDIKLQGKAHEKEDLTLVMRRLEHWAHRLFPRMQFDDALNKIEKLGSKKEVSNYVKRIRLGLEDDQPPTTDEPPNTPPPPPEDPFDHLMESVAVPPQSASAEMTEEQRKTMLQNRLIAEERRTARLKRAQELKERFLESQAKRQKEASQIPEDQRRVTNQDSVLQGNNESQSRTIFEESDIQVNDEMEISVINQENHIEEHNQIEMNKELDESVIPELDSGHDDNNRIDNSK